jgi:hypothetical protein
LKVLSHYLIHDREKKILCKYAKALQVVGEVREAAQAVKRAACGSCVANEKDKARSTAVANILDKPGSVAMT